MNIEKIAEGVIPMMIMALMATSMLLYVDVQKLNDNYKDDKTDYRVDKKNMTEYILANHDAIIVLQKDLECKHSE